MQLSQKHAPRFFAFLLLFVAVCGELRAQDASVPSVVRAQKEATLSPLISGRITNLPFGEGDSFVEGDVLVRLDCAAYQSEADAAKAREVGAIATAKSRERLFVRGAIGQLDVEIAKAEVSALAATARTADLRVEGCTISAPFDGRVAELFVNAFEYVSPGQPIVTIVSSGTPYVEIIAPSEWLAWIEPGAGGRLQLVATSSEHYIRISTIGPVVDPVSRTLKLKGEFDLHAEGVLPGMSGLVRMEQSN